MSAMHLAEHIGMTHILLTQNSGNWLRTMIECSLRLKRPIPLAILVAFLCSDNEAANLLGRYYQKESRLFFNSKDKLIAKSARDFIHKNHFCPSGHNTVFNKDFTMMDLEIAFQEMDFDKSPGMDGIYGQMLVN
ncbi:uncharacterized protein TNCV_1168011 [Trichonephila clavipes]|uniref:Uncharacterized protein n=1 Tax=Trichonephila clavipes TaxID=2585209 RepID=A0A8X6SYI1_TRICX|nr:uncharacterized protein TNCV_1168011 [Trichonephila clavipes]